MSESYLGNCERGSIDVPGLISLEVLVITRYGYGTLSSAQEEAKAEDAGEVIRHHASL